MHLARCRQSGGVTPSVACGSVGRRARRLGHRSRRGGPQRTRGQWGRPAARWPGRVRCVAAYRRCRRRSRVPGNRPTLGGGPRECVRLGVGVRWVSFTRLRLRFIRSLGVVDRGRLVHIWRIFGVAHCCSLSCALNSSTRRGSRVRARDTWRRARRGAATAVAAVHLLGRDDPDFHCRAELRDNVPRVVEFGWRAKEHQSEIRQKHLRAAAVDDIANLVYRMWIIELHDVRRARERGFLPPTTQGRKRYERQA
jgi:hypothetical protein